MSLNKRIKGDFTIESIDSGDQIIMHQAGGITIDGDLTVLGTSTAVESTDTTIVDNVIVLNSGEPGTGVSEGTAGFNIDRGSSPMAGIQFDEADDTWKLNIGNGIWTPIGAGGGGGINNVVEDLTPQLGGNLDVNGQLITSAAGGDIVIVADTTGLVKIDQELSLAEQAAPTLPDGVAGYNKLSAGTIGAGGSGLYFVNDTDTDELVSKKKAIIYGIIF